MSTIQNETEQIVNAASQLPPPELDQLVARLQALRRQTNLPRLPVQESELLRRINQGAPAELQRRYDALRRKRRRSELSRKERQELLSLTQQIEQSDVERLQLLAQLATLRKLSLPELMRQLGLEPPEPEYD
ncbi:MAG: STAS/SEC14 domain-containing protein [Acidobacteriota bacterium]|nr:STAS/SEC14 domain-containing protein [Acidobacteriota bacterium]